MGCELPSALRSTRRPGGIMVASRVQLSCLGLLGPHDEGRGPIPIDYGGSHNVKQSPCSCPDFLVFVRPVRPRLLLSYVYIFTQPLVTP